MEIIKRPVAIPFLLNTACRNGTMAKSNMTARKLRMPDCFGLSIFFFDIPRCLGSKIVVANGQIFLHIPSPTTNNAGAMGIKIFQNNMIPNEGEKSKQLRITTPISQKINWAIRQENIALEENWFGK
jgi:hypothetical protein